MPEIRKYLPKDKDNLRKICVETTLIPLNDKTRAYIPILWNDYYTEQEPENIFVLDDGGQAVGYIIAASSPDYFKKMRNIYLPKVKKISWYMALVFRIEMLADKKLYKKYGSHLHIDLLPPYQRGGWGSKLTDALLSRLKQKGLNGVYLGTTEKNIKGVNFYRKYGFKQVRKIGENLTFALTF